MKMKDLRPYILTFESDVERERFAVAIKQIKGYGKSDQDVIYEKYGGRKAESARPTSVRRDATEEWRVGTGGDLYGKPKQLLIKGKLIWNLTKAKISIVNEDGVQGVEFPQHRLLSLNFFTGFQGVPAAKLKTSDGKAVDVMFGNPQERTPFLQTAGKYCPLLQVSVRTVQCPLLFSLIFLSSFSPRWRTQVYGV